MAKIIIEVFVFTRGQRFDFALPDRMKLETVMGLITDSLSCSAKLRFDMDKLVLACQDDKSGEARILNLKSTLAQEKVPDGARLILF